MKAAVRSKYGSQDVLSIQEIETPTPKANEVLIKVYATTVNRTDCGILLGKPKFIRLFSGLPNPRFATTGSDFAGQIEAVGSEVKSFKAGDKVMGFAGMGCSSHAQYLTIKAKEIITIPGNITYDQAVACMEGAFYAYSSVVELKPKPGQKVLVNGGTGAIGSSCIQFLKLHGTNITAVCNGENAELVRSLGADKIIDYKTQDFTKDTEKYDVVVDAVGKSTFAKCKHLLKKKGIYTSTDGLENFLLRFITPLFGGKKVLFSMPTNIPGYLIFIKDLLEKGRFKPVIDKKRYSLDKIAEAYKYVLTGQKIGNVILTMDV